MAEGWDKYDPAPIETFHHEALNQFHALAKEKGTKLFHKGFGEEVPVLDGIGVNQVLADFKRKVKEEYGISSKATPKQTSKEESPEAP